MSSVAAAPELITAAATDLANIRSAVTTAGGPPPTTTARRRQTQTSLDHIVELTTRGRDAGHIPADADTKAVAVTVFSLMHGLIVMHHLVEDVPADVLLRGVSSLGAATDGS